MKLLSLYLGAPFRSLPEKFCISFNDKKDMDLNNGFQPFCLVGLNGCGKSNVLEALSHIFFHLELCVCVHVPEQFAYSDTISREKWVIDDFELTYLHSSTESDEVKRERIEQVRITKSKGKSPRMFVSYPYGVITEEKEVSLVPFRDSGIPAEGKRFLPKYIVAYSSGENETISIPYIKSRLIHLDEYRDSIINNYMNSCVIPENGLIYVDSNMSQAILLCCLLFENDTTLDSLSRYDTTGIKAIHRFRMSLKKHEIPEAKTRTCTYFDHIEKDILDKFDACSTLNWIDKETGCRCYDFYVNEATKRAFKHHFYSGIECFHAFRLLYELNYYNVSKEKRNEIYESKGIYTENKFSLPYPEDDIFHFLDFFITKQIGKEGETKDILLKSFSDGEHQYIHTMAICLLLKDSDSLILLDEPETHFNPNWRSLFVSMLNETLINGCSDSTHDYMYCNFMKEVLITSHSPFIISDCQPSNVIILRKNEDGKTEAKSAKELNIKTYGTSENVITASIFGNVNSIGSMASKEMDRIRNDKSMGKKDIDYIRERFGDSVEKLILMSELKHR